MKQQLISWIEAHKETFETLAKNIWLRPELGLQETAASAWHRQMVEDAGFRIESLEGLPTAFVAEYGSGSPIIGVLGEYDALANASQSVSAQPEAVKEGAPGHGCGHNLLGVAALAAALALQKLMTDNDLPGTLRYYGCPAEEMLYGKAVMARHGVFDDLDACLGWHPSAVNMPWAGSLLAICSVEFTFEGRSAHAGAAPHLGRSALDAVELMDVGANFMREHVLESSRIHYIITNGGKQPNTVPAEASVWYNLRAQAADDLIENYQWLTEIATGAAMMTQTTCRPVDFKSGVYDVRTNQRLARVLEANMRAIGAPVYSEEDHRFADALTATLTPADKRKGMDSLFIPASLKDTILHEDILAPTDAGRSQSASTDAGDVSQITPYAQFSACTWPMGVVPHTWQATAAAGSHIGFVGMIFAAKVLATSLYDCLTQPDLIADAQAEFTADTEGRPYQSLIDRMGNK